MNEQQRAMLLDVISEWAGLVNERYALPRMAEIKAGLDETYFAWSGPTVHGPGRNGSAYYRIQGPKLVVEFSPQGVGGDPTMQPGAGGSAAVFAAPAAALHPATAAFAAGCRLGHIKRSRHADELATTGHGTLFP